MAKGYWIARVDVHNDEGYKPYAAANPGIFQKFGGRFVVRAGKSNAAEGESRPNVVIEFPDYRPRWPAIDSPEYQENIKVRRPHVDRRSRHHRRLRRPAALISRAHLVAGTACPGYTGR